MDNRNLVMLNAEVLADTESAYMRGSYGEKSWRLIAEFLLRQAFTVEEASWIMNSKHMRWADDFHGRGDGKQANRAAFKRYYAVRRSGILEGMRAA